MAIAVDVQVMESELWPQGDARDPLGTWSARNVLIGDASGGPMTGNIIVLAERRRGRIYTCYSAMSVRIGGAADTGTFIKVRLLTNWPDADPTADGVQGFATYRSSDIDILAAATLPNAGPSQTLITPNDRFILLFDPSSVFSGSNMAILQIERDANVLTTQVTFEAYGYYWDRGVLDAPGGPRHPGSR